MGAEPADDWSLLAAWRNGDADSGDRLAERYFPLLSRFFINKVRCVDDAEELVAETFLGCSVSKDRTIETESFHSYLFGIALNKLRGYYRKQTKRKRELDDFAEVCVDSSPGSSPSVLVARSQETRLLVRALRRLTLAQQIVLELAYFEELSGPQIAELLGVPGPTVYTHLSRGRQRLAKIIRELADNSALAESTVCGLETWARKIRANIVPD